MTEERFVRVPMRVWNGLPGLAAAFGILAVIGGGGFALLEYFDRKASARAAQTLEMIDIWDTRGAQTAYLEISRALQEEIADLDASDAVPDERVPIVEGNIARRVLREVGDETYLTIVQFFTRLSLCVQSQLCSAQVAATFFGETLADFRHWFRREIADRQKLTRSHGRELDWLLCRFLEFEDDLLERVPGLSCPQITSGK
ncbi:MAG: hypothetical protein AAF311_14665 [Pseudomonadota bacterium]